MIKHITRYLLILCFLLQAGCCQQLFGRPVQLSAKDSLLLIWTNARQPDTARLKAINKYTKILLDSNAIETALVYNRLEYQLAESKGLIKYMGRAKTTEGDLCRAKGDNLKAIDVYLDALNLFMKVGDKKAIQSALFNISAAYKFIGDYKTAIEYQYRRLKLAELAKDTGAIASGINMIGTINKEMGNLDIALDFHERALHLHENRRDTNAIAGALNNLGIDYRNKKDTAKSAYYFNRSILLYEYLKDIHGVGMVSNNIGNVQKDKGDLQGALKSYLRSMQVDLDLKNHSVMAMNNVGITYRELGNLPLAIKYCTQSLIISQQNKNPPMSRGSSQSLYKTYKLMGDYKKSLEMYELYHLYNDSLESKANQKEVLKQKIQYDYDKKQSLLAAEQEKKNEIAKAEARQERILRNVTLAGLFIVGIFSISVVFQRNKIKKEKRRSENLLLNILPLEVAEELKVKGKADAKFFDDVTVLFTDFKSFTTVSEQLSPQQLVDELHECFSAFDHIMQKYNVEKIKTVGDAYLAVSGLPTANPKHAEAMVQAAIEIKDFMTARKLKINNRQCAILEARIGIHSGSVVAGIVGIKKFAYDIWGDTVNTAARMEQHGETGKINISEATYELIKDKFNCQYRGEIEAKNKGHLKMYFLA